MSPPKVVRVAFDYTLMRLTDSGGHVPSGTRPKTWFFELEDTARAAAEAALLDVFRLENMRLHANEPSDPNFLAPVAFTPETIEPPPAGPFPWEKEPRVWERSTCWARSATLGLWMPISPGDFTMLYLVRRLQAGTLDRETFLRLATKDLFSLPAADAETILANPEDFLKTRLRL